MRKTDMKFSSNNEIVEYLYRNNYFQYIGKKFNNISSEDRDDLISIVIESLLKMDTNKLISLYERDKLLGYITRMFKIQCYSNVTSTPFYSEIRRFKQHSIEFDLNIIEKNNDDDIYE